MCEFVRESREYDVVKWALSGTTLADINEKSYVSRLNQEIDAQEVCDCFICQLSTNEASKNLPLGTISESSDKIDLWNDSEMRAYQFFIYSYEKEHPISTGK